MSVDDAFREWIELYGASRSEIAGLLETQTLVPLVRALAQRLAFASERVSGSDSDPKLNDFELSVLAHLVQSMNAFVESAFGGSTFGTIAAARASLETAAIARHVVADPDTRAERLERWWQNLESGDPGRWYDERIVDLVKRVRPADASEQLYRGFSKLVHLNPRGRRLTGGIAFLHYDELRRYAREASTFAKATVVVLTECLPVRGAPMLELAEVELAVLSKAVADCASQLNNGGNLQFAVADYC